jgi:hypothetical protein
VSEIVSFFADHRSTILAGAYVQMLTLFLLTLFLLALLFATLSEDVMPGRPSPEGSPIWGSY